MKVCSSCGTESPARAKFCLECAAPLAPAAAAAREERKVVTCLFCDLVGFTSRAERLDPEEVRALLRPYHAGVRGVLERHGGTVEKFIGDAVMAVFGAPVAHEDDPERAVRAALAIREGIVEEGELQVRVGVTTGEALVALGARPEAGEGMASGDVVNTAARLQAAAPVNGILVDETTFHATDRVIAYRAHEPVAAKGKAEPVRVHEAVEARARFGTDVRQIGRAPLVGRAEELEALRSALARATGERHAELVTLVGVPGMGKSRLVWELFQLVDAAPELVTWRQGRSLPYGDGISFWALGEMVKAHAGILETDPPDEAQAKLRTVSADAWVESHLRPLVGLAAEPGRDRRDEAFAAWRRFLEGLAEDGPLVLVFEDLHWADDGLLDFVDHLVEWASAVPLLVVGTARPELLARRPGWGGGKPHALTLSLSPLSDDETARLVHALLERSVLDAELRATLLERAGGNPLYAEEFVRLLEAGRRGVGLPESVQGIIAARLDALPPEEKELLREAAVLGKVFWLGALGAERWTSETLLHALERKEFIRRERRSSVASETEYAFRHALVRDVAYDQIPRAERSERHARAADWIESLGRSETHAELLAHHRLAALEYARAAGRDPAELAAAARVAAREAADRALAVHAFPAASRHYEGALGLTGDDAPDRWRLLLGLGRALHGSGSDRAEQVLHEAAAAARAAGEPEAAAEAEALVSHVQWFRGFRDESLASVGRAVELIADAPPSPTKARVLARQATALMLAGRWASAVEVGTEALRIAEELGLDPVRVEALTTVGGARGALGDRGGEEDLLRAVEIARAADLPEEARALNNLAAMRSVRAELGEAATLSRRALEVARRFGDRSLARFVEGNLIESDMLQGDWDGALARADAFLAECEAGARTYMEPAVRMARAAIRLHRDDRPGALQDVRRAVAVARQTKDPQAVLPTLAHAAELAGEAAAEAEANAYLDEYLAEQRALETLFASTDAAFAALVLGREAELAPLVEEEAWDSPWAGAGRALLAHDFRRAAETFAAVGAPPLEARARLWSAAELAEAGRSAEADAEARRAAELYRSLGATPSAARADALRAAAG